MQISGWQKWNKCFRYFYLLSFQQGLSAYCVIEAKKWKVNRLSISKVLGSKCDLLGSVGLLAVAVRAGSMRIASSRLNRHLIYQLFVKYSRKICYEKFAVFCIPFLRGRAIIALSALAEQRWAGL